MKPSCVPALALGGTILFGVPGMARAAELDRAMLEGLKPMAALVGKWKGQGTSPTSPGWNESLVGGWGFRAADGRVAIELFVDPIGDEKGELEAGLVTFDPASKEFGFVARMRDERVLHFKGELAGERILRLARFDPDAKDGFDRAEIKVVRGGDKLIYGFSKKLGSRFYELHTQVEFQRQGTSESDYDSGPFCVVTGGAGRMAVELDGETYPVACEACAEEFLAHPEKYKQAAH